MSGREQEISKFLSYVLRHKPDEIGLTLDGEGWADIDELIAGARASMPLTREQIAQVVTHSDKQRFAISADGLRIRANQGHSIKVDLALEPRQPPDVLFHGTATRFVDAIARDGLCAMSRQHVHLSLDESTAINVGKRHGKPVVLRIRAGQMWNEGIKFYLSENGVWLTGGIEPHFINFPNHPGKRPQ